MLKHLSEFTWRFIADEDGPTAVEYAVLIMLIILACLASIQIFGLEVSESFSNSSQQIQDVLN